MPDTTRRFALANRSRALRSNANALMDCLKDNGLKSMVRVSVLHPLDDIDSLFLGDPDNRPSMPVNEDMWLNNVEFEGALTVSTFSEYAMMVFVFFIAMEQLQIANELLTAAFIIAFGAVGLAFAIAFGMGAKDWAGRVIEKIANNSKK